jgi:Flp pilus assembly pilin Flp
MRLLAKLQLWIGKLSRGQSMAEYALILAAVAVIAYTGYQVMGTTITSLLSTVDGKL